MSELGNLESINARLCDLNIINEEYNIKIINRNALNEKDFDISHCLENGRLKDIICQLMNEVFLII